MSHVESYDLKKGKAHPYHILAPSVWPLVGAFAAGALAVLAVLYMHNETLFGIKPGILGVIAGFTGVLLVMYFWWRDVIIEAFVEKAHTGEAKTGLRMGMLLFISSEVMFFFAFFWAFFTSSLFPTEAIGGTWPPAGIEVIATFSIPFLMTMVLLLSGCTVTWAHHALLEGKNDDAAKALLITVILGIAFMFIQAYEYQHSSFGFKENVYSSVFYMATGFHGFHVLVGTIFLAVCYFRTIKGHFTKDDHFGFEAAAWYWHFVDVVWLFLFVAIYWWGNA